MRKQDVDYCLSRRQILRLLAAGSGPFVLAACRARPRKRPSAQQRTGASKADGRILFAKTQTIDNGGKDDGIYTLQNGSNVTKLLSKGDGDYALQYPRWSPDGSRIAFVRAGDGGIFSNLWIMNADTSNPRQITDFQSKIPHKNDVNAEQSYVADSSIVAGPSWSQGGNFITFASDKGPPGMLRPWSLDNPDQPPTIPKNLHVIDATKTFSPSVKPFLHIDDTALAPDGSMMAFVGLWAQPDDPTNKQTQIYLLDFGTKKYTQLTDLPPFKWGAYDPAFSPDGQEIAFTGRPDYRVNDLFIMTRDGKNPVQITQTGAARAPVWSPDGKKLAFLAAFEGAQFNIYAMDVTPVAPGAPFTAASFGKPEKLTDEKGIDARSGLSWTA